MARKAMPIAVLDNSKWHMTAEEMEARANGEPKGADDSLVPPKALSKEAKKEWDRLVALYRQLDAPILNNLDTGILSAYCECRAIYERAQKELKKDPTSIVWTEKGPVENPLIKILDKQGQLIAKYGEQLALSPVSRARIGIAKAKKELEDDPMAALLASGGR